MRLRWLEEAFEFRAAQQDHPNASKRHVLSAGSNQVWILLEQRGLPASRHTQIKDASLSLQHLTFESESVKGAGFNGR
jgi:hypothetical protein